jgi:hypothetical protein
MSDYQAIYDAVRSRISGGNIGDVAERAIYSCLDFSHARALLQEAIGIASYEYSRPSTVLRPKIFIDGTMYCALYGDNLQDGVAGFGDTAAAAFEDFDRNWNKQTVAQAEHAARPGQVSMPPHGADGEA